MNLLSAETYFDQAELKAANWLVRAVRSIDEAVKEPGYAKANPALLGAYLQVCAMEHLTSRGVDHLCDRLDSIEAALRE